MCPILRPILCPSCHTLLCRDVVDCMWLELHTGQRHSYGRCTDASRPMLVAAQPWEDIDL